MDVPIELAGILEMDPETARLALLKLKEEEGDAFDTKVMRGIHDYIRSFRAHDNGPRTVGLTEDGRFFVEVTLLEEVRERGQGPMAAVPLGEIVHTVEYEDPAAIAG